jgi:hypothetical protein
MSPWRSPGGRIGSILLLAGLLRLGWVLLVPNAQYSDSVWYSAAAWNLVANGFYGVNAPSAWFPPGYPFFLAAIYAVAGHSELAGKLGGVALGILLCGGTYLLARRFLGEAVALTGAILVAVWPNLIFSTGILSSDVLAACGFVLTMWLGLRRRLGWPSLIGLGLLGGWMVLVRPVSIILFAALGVWWLLETGSVRRTAAYLAPAVLVAGLLVGAWSVRNALQFGQPILIATNGGYNFWQTNHRFADGNDTYWQSVPMDDPEYHTMYYGDEFTKNSAGYRYALAYLQAHPGHLIQMFPTKLFWLYHTDTSGFYEGVYYAPMDGPSPLAAWIDARQTAVEQVTFRYYAALMALAGLGVGLLLVLGRGRAAWLWALLLLPLLLSLFHLFFHAKDRFHMPLDGIIAIFAATAIVEVARLSLRLGRRRLPAVLGQDEAGRLGRLVGQRLAQPQDIGRHGGEAGQV